MKQSVQDTDIAQACVTFIICPHKDELSSRSGCFRVNFTHNSLSQTISANTLQGLCIVSTHFNFKTHEQCKECGCQETRSTAIVLDSKILVK